MGFQVPDPPAARPTRLAPDALRFAARAGEARRSAAFRNQDGFRLKAKLAEDSQ